ncbi:hypothetical protein DFP73DRAFT_593246 [Morchella snyderi]|nr:hypothetical protein DFP73DRAFT_593246 [Morchella snyderi]
MKLSTLTLQAASLAFLGASHGAEQLVPFKYDSLPLGSIKPLGWLKDQLRLSAEGLAGHEWDFYRFAMNSTWSGGTWEYSGLHETAPYWFNYIVPLAWSLDDARLKAQAKEFLDSVLDAQQEDGWLGPETAKGERGLWARALLLYGMIQYAEADPSETERIVAAMHRFVNLAYAMLKDNYTGLVPVSGDVFGAGNHGVTRAHELATQFQWLYDKYPNGNEENIWGAIDLMFKGGISAQRDWREFFVEGVFPTVAMPAIVDRRFVHGVDLAEGLRWTTALYRLDKNESLTTQAHDSVDMLFKYHGADSGTITADELLAGMSPNRGSELCMAVETMYSMSYLYRFYGTNSFADRAETVAFNALPAMVSPDWWSHQYVAQANQPWAFNISGNPYVNVNNYGNTFGLEPNYPCCTVNHPQGYPKFLAASFMKVGTSDLLHALLSPTEAITTLGDNNKVTVTADTNYPFNPTIKYTITAQSAFTFHIRIPAWADLSTSTITLGISNPVALSPTTDNHQLVSVRAGTTTFSITFGQTVSVVQRANSAVALHRGPLLYALDLDYTTESFSPLTYNAPTVPLPAYQVHLPESQDHFLKPVGKDWAIAIDTSSIQVNDMSDSVTPLKNPIFAKGAPPVELKVKACPIEWGVTNDVLAEPPVAPVCTGDAKVVSFRPYGSTKLRMTELPVVNLS